MGFVGLIISAAGTWAFFNPEKALEAIYRNFYKKELRPSKGKTYGAKVIAVVWVVVGLLIFFKG